MVCWSSLFIRSNRYRVKYAEKKEKNIEEGGNIHRNAKTEGKKKGKKGKQILPQVHRIDDLLSMDFSSPAEG